MYQIECPHQLIGRNFSETHLIQTVIIRFIANCKRSIVSQHEVRSRQSDHTHRQRQNADKGLELVLEKITNGNLEVVREEDPVDPPPDPSTREGSMMYWVMIVMLHICDKLRTLPLTCPRGAMGIAPLTRY